MDKVLVDWELAVDKNRLRCDRVGPEWTTPIERVDSKQDVR